METKAITAKEDFTLNELSVYIPWSSFELAREIGTDTVRQ